MRSALCGFGSPTRFYADTTDIMAEVEGFGKGSQLLVTSKVVEVLLPFLYCPCWTDRQAIVTGTAMIQRWRIDLKREIGENGDQTNSRSKLIINEEVVPAYPSQSRSPRHMFMRKVSPLIFPIHQLRGRDRHGLVSEILNRRSHDQADGVEKNVNSLIVMEIKWSGLVLNLFQNGIRKTISHRDSVRKSVQ